MKQQTKVFVAMTEHNWHATFSNCICLVAHKLDSAKRYRSCNNFVGFTNYEIEHKLASG